MFHQAPGIYRDQLGSLLSLHAELVDRRSRELSELPRELRAVYSRRVARTAAGITAFVVMTAVFLASAGLTIYYAFDIPRPLASFIGIAAVASWALSVVVYAIGRVLAARAFDRRLALNSAQDLHANISYLSQLDPKAVVYSAIARWEQRSIAWPLMGIAVTVPLLLHYVAMMLLTGELALMADFGMWIGLSALIVGHVHYFVGSQGAAFARDIADSPDDRVPLLTGRGWRALVVAVGTSLMPGLAALGVPCLLVAATGLVFLPASYWAMHRIAIRERRAVSLSD